MPRSHIRKSLDNEFNKMLNAEERRQIETLPAPDRFKLKDGQYDPQMRQFVVDGSRLISVLPTGAAYSSKTIKELDKV